MLQLPPNSEARLFPILLLKALMNEKIHFLGAFNQWFSFELESLIIIHILDYFITFQTPLLTQICVHIYFFNEWFYESCKLIVSA